MLVIFDNLLVLGDSYEDLYGKMEKVLKIARENNLQLKFAKTFLGFASVKFFGYICEHNRYRVDPERAAKIDLIPIPTNRTAIQSFLGHGQMYAPHCKSYSLHAAPLTEMTKKDFNWKDKNVWTDERYNSFSKVKEIIRDAYYLYYPNYEWTFLLIVDASKWGCAGVLYQVNPETNVQEPIACVSHKFSSAAQKWSGIDQEAFGNFWPILQLQKYLLGKSFILYTDHFNLLYIEKSIVPRIMRMKVFMQQFHFLIAHIKGKLNVVSDYWSRIYAELEHEEQLMFITQYLYHTKITEDFEDSVKEKFLQVHNSSSGHFGTRTTYHKLNLKFPGHKIPYATVHDMIQSCAICQKTRLAMNSMDTIQPIHRPLYQSNYRKRVGIDTLTITPPDKHNKKFVYVIVVPTTKLVFTYAAEEHTALNAARALFSFYITYGIYEVIISDPGTEFTANIIKHLHEWLGVQQLFSVVDRHQSNGVEGTNKQILRHLRALITDKRFKDRWSEVEVLGLITYIINSNISSETKCSAYDLHFGRSEKIYFKLPETKNENEISSAYVQALEDDLLALREISKQHMEKIAKERAGEITCENQNQFQPGDLVLFDLNPNKTKLRKAKLDNEFRGPYEVVGQNKNDVICKHLSLKTFSTLEVSRLKIYHHDNTIQSREQAIELARTDADQYNVKSIMAYLGNPFKPRTMRFEIELENGEVGWAFLKEVTILPIFEDYCRNIKPELKPLLYEAAILPQIMKQYVFSDKIKIGQIFYLTLKYFDKAGNTYEDLNLPDLYRTDYLFECKYLNWNDTTHKKTITFHITVIERKR